MIKFLFFVLIIIFLDQYSKFLIIAKMKPFTSVPIIENIFHITYVQNKGAAFGFLQNKILFFIFVTIIVTVVILFLLWKTRNKDNFSLFHFSIILQLGGAIGNLVDRVRLGYVVDFFDFRIWPVFNIADISIVIGVIILSWYVIKNPNVSNKYK